MIVELNKLAIAVKVNPDEENFCIAPTGLHYSRGNNSTGIVLGSYDLPPGYKYELLGMLKDVSEDQWKGVLPLPIKHFLHKEKDIWEDYTYYTKNAKTTNNVFYSATESGLSLCAYKGVTDGLWIVIKREGI